MPQLCVTVISDSFLSTQEAAQVERVIIDALRRINADADVIVLPFEPDQPPPKQQARH